MNLIFIHGRAQQGKKLDELKSIWIDTFKEGLNKSKLKLPINEKNIFFPYYGDELDNIIKNFNKPIDELIKRGSNLDNDEAAYIRDLLTEISKNAKISESEILEENLKIYGERGILNWEFIQSILKVFDRNGFMDNFSLKQFTYDVFMYLTNLSINNYINKFVLKQIGNHPCVVVAHSLGSVIAYNILRNNDHLNVCKFITVGSPLGLNSIKKHLERPIMMPECVKNGWYNAFDESDFVSLLPLNKDNFNISPEIINSNHVNNTTDNNHGIEGYLNDEIIAKEIYIALTSKFCV